MSSPMQTIYLLGKPYKIRCPAGKEDELAQTALVLNNQLQETQRNSGLTGREDIIMMTALNLCHQELLRSSD